MLERLGMPQVAIGLAVDYNAVGQWKKRNMIPAQYWIDLVDWSYTVNRRGISLEGLAQAAKEARR